MNLRIRLAQIEDIDRLTEIYNEAILSESCTCDTEVFRSSERLEWFNEHRDEKFPLYACVVDEKVMGYGYLSPYRGGRKAVENVAEISYYLDFSIHGMGVGSKLVEFLIEDAKKNKITTLLAILVESNSKSIKLLEKFNFKEWGRLLNIVNLKEEKIDHLYYGKHLNL